MADYLECSPQECKNSEHDLPKSPETVMIELPTDIAAAITQHCIESGQTQTQAVLEALRSVLGCSQTSSVTAAVTNATTDATNVADSATADLLTPVLAELQSLKDRLAAIESFIPRLEELEGKWMAF